ncbi:MAG: hypothetical protein IJD43_13860 [Thermoguttaceae bacterium]|nr:hypothetical protein [Thermoguttaceae bacterium]MBQ4144548.1 hypothetical protein [Thermoguttaceae bacterium]
MKRFLAFFLSALFLTTAAVQAQLPEIAGRIRSMAHRGDYHNAPDNTIPSLKMAIATGVDSCEFDVRRTKDGVLILSHDATFAHASNGACTRAISDMTFEETQAVDVGAYKGEAWKGTKCPTLEETLLLFKGSGCIPVIEIKQPGTEEDIAAMLKKHDMVKECAIVSFDHESIRKMWELCPGIYAYRNGGDRKGMSDEEYVQWFIDSQRDCPFKVANPHVKNMNVNTVKLLKKAGFTVSTWIVDDPEKLNELLDAGIDTMTTNRPAVFVEVMKEREKAGKK